MLAAMFREGQIGSERDTQGRYFIDRDGTHFGIILNYLRDRQLPIGVPVEVRRALYAEARFYNVADLIEWTRDLNEVLPDSETRAIEHANTCTLRIVHSVLQARHAIENYTETALGSGVALGRVYCPTLLSAIRFEFVPK